MNGNASHAIEVQRVSQQIGISLFKYRSSMALWNIASDYYSSYAKVRTGNGPCFSSLGFRNGYVWRSSKLQHRQYAQPEILRN